MLKFHANTARSFLGKCVNVHLNDGAVYPNVLFKSMVRCGGSQSIHSWDLLFSVENTKETRCLNKSSSKSTRVTSELRKGNIVIGMEKIHFLEKVNIIG